MLEIGTSFGAPTEREIELAEALGKVVPKPLQRSLFLGSGSDSNEAALQASLDLRDNGGQRPDDN